MKTFYVPYQVVAFFNSKKKGAYSGEYQFHLSHRVYLYLLHYKSGRINKENIKELIEFFSSTKRSILNALKHLKETSLIKESTNYFQAIGESEFKKIHKSILKDKFKCKFDESDLLNVRKFRAKVFSFLSEKIAKDNGSKNLFRNGFIVKDVKTIKSRFDIKILNNQFILKDSKQYEEFLTSPFTTERDIERASFFSYELNWTQRQGSAYLSDKLGRGRKTVINRIKESKQYGFLKNHSVHKKVNLETKKITKVADSAVINPIIDGKKQYYFENFDEANNFKNYLLKNYQMNGKVYLKKESNVYFVMKNLPNEISYHLNLKDDFI